MVWCGLAVRWDSNLVLGSLLVGSAKLSHYASEYSQVESNIVKDDTSRPMDWDLRHELDWTGSSKTIR